MRCIEVRCTAQLAPTMKMRDPFLQTGFCEAAVKNVCISWSQSSNASRDALVQLPDSLPRWQYSVALVFFKECHDSGDEWEAGQQKDVPAAAGALLRLADLALACQGGSRW